MPAYRRRGAAGVRASRLAELSRDELAALIEADPAQISSPRSASSASTAPVLARRRSCSRPTSRCGRLPSPRKTTTP